MPYRSPARYLALVAVLASALAVYLVVQSGMKDEPSSSPTTATTTVKAKPAKRGKRTYTVRAGDTLSAIAARTHVPLERLQELNPDIDVNTLNTGQRLKLRPSS